ncbi:MAG: oligoendopeptidase F, partial [Lachnospiraceae bacterium]|nr:oligoendopeptidase F [Lachnospiraceae bacterium]
MSEIRKNPKREEMDAKDCWRLEDLYASDAVWEKDLLEIQRQAGDFARYQGKLAQSSKTLLEALTAQDAILLRMERLYVYASQKSHLDMGNARWQDMADRAQFQMVQVSERLSFMEPELLEITEEVWERYLNKEPGLALYKRYMQEKRRKKAHILSKEMEEVLAKASEMGQSPQNIFMMFNNADIKFGSIQDENGVEQELTQGRYVQFLESRDRRVRQEAFEKLYASYDAFRNTLAATFSANIKQELFFARMRSYDSAREAALDQANVPLSVYDQLIEAVHSHLPSMYRYVRLRRKALGVEKLHMYDLHVPLVEKPGREYTFDQAKELVKEGLAPLGEDYVRLLEKGFEGGWIDVYENQGKRSGAYSWGAYGTHPYVLLNYNGTLNHVFTLAHEMGHALHSYHSDKNQPYIYAGYKIFVAEVASTCNEALLIHHLLAKAPDKDEEAYLVNYFLDQFKGTVFRQTMFAEFERTVHEMAQKSEALTAENLCRIYYGLNEKYYGPDMEIDEAIEMEWARIPHFYNPFYVYQYATGFSAAIAISSKILAGEPGIVEKYKQFLSGGNSMDCIDLLKICGVDMTSKDPVQSALQVFEEY